MANSVDPDLEQSDLSLHCLQREASLIWSYTVYVPKNLGTLWYVRRAFCYFFKLCILTVSSS